MATNVSRYDEAGKACKQGGLLEMGLCSKIVVDRCARMLPLACFRVVPVPDHVAIELVYKLHRRFRDMSRVRCPGRRG